MKYIVFLVSFSFSVSGVRDPFFYPDRSHRYVLIGIGSIQNKPSFATIMIDGLSYCVRAGQVVCDHTVEVITDEGITLKDCEGVFHRLVQKKTLQLR